MTALESSHDSQALHPHPHPGSGWRGLLLAHNKIMVIDGDTVYSGRNYLDARWDSGCK